MLPGIEIKFLGCPAHSLFLLQVGTKIKFAPQHNYIHPLPELYLFHERSYMRCRITSTAEIVLSYNLIINYYTNLLRLPPYTIMYGCLQRVTVPDAVIIQFVLLKMSIVLLETC